MTEKTPAIVVENIHKRFGKNKVLKGVSFSADQGDVVAILGSSGSGKSTLLRCINLLEVPNKGKVSINGEEIKMVKKGDSLKPADNKQVDSIRCKLGMVFQSFNLWSHMTVLENIIEAPLHVLKISQSEAVARAERLLEKVGLSDKGGFFPAQLSGGQQQRVAIARSLAMEPQALLFDEPTSALDPELVGEVLRVMRALAKEGRTMLIVTHEIGFAKEVSSKVLFLHEGLIEEAGPPEKVIENPDSERIRQFLSQSFGKV